MLERELAKEVCKDLSIQEGNCKEAPFLSTIPVRTCVLAHAVAGLSISMGGSL